MKKKLLWISVAVVLGLLVIILWPEAPRSVEPPYTLSPITAADLDILLGGGSAALETWLKSKGFSGQFPTEESMISYFAEPLLRSGYPVPAEQNGEFSLSWYVGIRHDFSFYDGKLQYHFQILQDAQTVSLPVFPVATYRIGDQDVQFYRGKGCIVGDFTSSGYRVRITVRGYAELEEISFDHIFWQEPQSSEP